MERYDFKKSFSTEDGYNIVLFVPQETGKEDLEFVCDEMNIHLLHDDGIGDPYHLGCRILGTMTISKHSMEELSLLEKVIQGCTIKAFKLMVGKSPLYTVEEVIAMKLEVKENQLVYNFMAQVYSENL